MPDKSHHNSILHYFGQTGSGVLGECILNVIFISGIQTGSNYLHQHQHKSGLTCELGWQPSVPRCRNGDQPPLNQSSLVLCYQRNRSTYVHICENTQLSPRKNLDQKCENTSCLNQFNVFFFQIWKQSSTIQINCKSKRSTKLQLLSV